MKKTLLFTGLLAIGLLGGTMNTKAQTLDAKVNFGGLLFNSYGGNFEYILNEQMGVSFGVDYFGKTFDDFGLDDYKLSGLRLTADFRFYFSPDDDAEGFFAAPYVKYRNWKTSGWSSTVDENGNVVDLDYSMTGIAGGLIIGKKWVTDSGFLFELNGGAGKYLTNTVTYTVDGYDPLVGPTLFDIDFRFGILIGWRF